MATTVSAPGAWINRFFPRHQTDRQMREWKNIWWRVLVSHIPPRDPFFEYERDFGSGLIPAVLAGDPFRPDMLVGDGRGIRLLFVFPERHLTTQEEYIFLHKLKEHPLVMGAQLAVIDVVTKSPLLIGSLLRDDIRILNRTET